QIGGLAESTASLLLLFQLGFESSQAAGEIGCVRFGLHNLESLLFSFHGSGEIAVDRLALGQHIQRFGEELAQKPVALQTELQRFSGALTIRTAVLDQERRKLVQDRTAFGPTQIGWQVGQAAAEPALRIIDLSGIAVCTRLV